MLAKLLVVLFTAALAVAAPVHAGFEMLSFVLTISSFEQTVGDRGSVDLRAIDIEGALGTWTVDIQYDPEIVAAVACDPAEDGVCDLENSSDTVRITGASAGGLTSDTTLATITFECIAVGESPLQLNFLILTIPEIIVEGELIDGAIDCAAGAVTIDGDVDCDGRVTSIDALYILQFHAALMPTLPCPEGADVNHDGRVDSIDAVLILQFGECLIEPWLCGPPGAAMKAKVFAY